METFESLYKYRQSRNHNSTTAAPELNRNTSAFIEKALHLFLFHLMREKDKFCAFCSFFRSTKSVRVGLIIIPKPFIPRLLLVYTVDQCSACKADYLLPLSSSRSDPGSSVLKLCRNKKERGRRNLPLTVLQAGMWKFFSSSW